MFVCFIDTTDCRQVAIALQQDIRTSPDINNLERLLHDRPPQYIQQVLSLPIDGVTALNVIASMNRAAILDYAIRRGLDINEADRSALFVAVSQKALQTVEILLKNGADVTFSEQDLKTVLHIAAERGNVDILVMILEHGGECLDINKREATGCTALSLACMNGHEQASLLLLQHGAEVNTPGGFPPLHAASLVGHLHLVVLLHKHDAVLDLQDFRGNTALHYACYKNHKRIVQFLLENGCDVSVKDRTGKSARDRASSVSVQALLDSRT